MKTSLILAALALASAAPAGYAQFGSGIVFDPTQSAHAAQQILQANQLYTTTLKTTQNIIGAYNLAQRMSMAPSSLYLQYENLGRQFWVPFTQPADTYGNLQQFINAIANGYGASAATQTASIQRTGQIAGYGSLSFEGQQAIAARGATVDLADAIDASSLQTVGTIRANSAQREADISALETASHSSDPAQHTEMATLQRINQALLIELRTQQEANQILQAQALQQMIGQKVQQDNLKSLFQVGNSYQQNFNAAAPQQTTAGSGVANSSSGSSSATGNQGVPPTSDQAPPWTDESTGLMWTRSDNAADLDFGGAVAYCKNLNRAGFSDWRLPEMEELKGIYDPSSNVPVNRPDLVALHIPGVPGPAHIKGHISISGLEISNSGAPPADIQTFDFGLGKVKSIKSNKSHPYMRALCVRKP